jgi:hypothetical protein
MISVKSFTTLDSALWETSIFTITLFLVSVWSGFANWVINTNWMWFLVIGILLGIKPLIKVFKN